jgi:hypothetical protein
MKDFEGKVAVTARAQQAQSERDNSEKDPLSCGHEFECMG